jgi:hypothetical protein
MSKYSHPNKTRKLHLNLQDIFARCEPDEDGCIIWQKALKSDGYGSLCIDQKRYTAHRWVAQLIYGPPEKGQVVMHSCDKPACVNPDHLRYGTQQENIADMRSKGRGFVPINKGDTHTQAKLSESKVREIRYLLDSGLFLQREIASRFGVNQSVISAIHNKRTWSHVK